MMIDLANGGGYFSRSIFYRSHGLHSFNENNNAYVDWLSSANEIILSSSDYREAACRLSLSLPDGEKFITGSYSKDRTSPSTAENLNPWLGRPNRSDWLGKKFVSIAIAGPNLKTPASNFGHVFILAHNNNPPELDSVAIEFVGVTEQRLYLQIQALFWKINGEYRFSWFMDKIREYDFEDRDIVTYQLSDENAKQSVLNEIEHESRHNYQFIFANCADGISNALKEVYPPVIKSKMIRNPSSMLLLESFKKEKVSVFHSLASLIELNSANEFGNEIHNLKVDFLKGKYFLRHEVNPQKYFLKMDDMLQTYRKKMQSKLYMSKDNFGRDKTVNMVDDAEASGSSGCLDHPRKGYALGKCDHRTGNSWSQRQSSVAVSAYIASRDRFTSLLSFSGRLGFSDFTSDRERTRGIGEIDFLRFSVFIRPVKVEEFVLFRFEAIEPARNEYSDNFSRYFDLSYKDYSLLLDRNDHSGYIRVRFGGGIIPINKANFGFSSMILAGLHGENDSTDGLKFKNEITIRNRAWYYGTYLRINLTNEIALPFGVANVQELIVGDVIPTILESDYTNISIRARLLQSRHGQNSSGDLKKLFLGLSLSTYW